jgi:hypothetical protein
MWIIPQVSGPEFQAFVTGFCLPFFSAVAGYAISIARHLIFEASK